MHSQQVHVQQQGRSTPAPRPPRGDPAVCQQSWTLLPIIHCQSSTATAAADKGHYMPSPLHDAGHSFE